MSGIGNQGRTAARVRRLRTLFAMVRNREDWTRPIDAAVDEPAVLVYMPPCERQAALEAFRDDLAEAVLFHTGEPARIFVAVNGNSIRFHVRAPGHRKLKGPVPVEELLA